MALVLKSVLMLFTFHILLYSPDPGQNVFLGDKDFGNLSTIMNQLFRSRIFSKHPVITTYTSYKSDRGQVVKFCGPHNVLIIFAL